MGRYGEIPDDEIDHVHRMQDGSEELVLRDYMGWYYAREVDSWDQYGPYEGHSPAHIMMAFERDTGMQAQLGDRILMKDQLKELTEGAPPQIVATGDQADYEVSQMMNGY